MSKREDFEVLVKEVYNSLYTYAYIRLKSRDNALDVVQESVLKAYKSFYSLRNTEFFKSWITRILINTINNYTKSEQKYNSIKELSFDDTITFDSSELEFIDLISTLDKKSESIIYLKYFLRYSDKEIAKALKIPVGTVKSKHSRSLKKLKNLLESGDNDEN